MEQIKSNTKIEDDTPALKLKDKPQGVDYVKIFVEENDDIPPTGLFLSHNGDAFMLMAGVDVMVPPKILEILDHAVMQTAIINPVTRQVDGWRTRARFPYRIVRD